MARVPETKKPATHLSKDDTAYHAHLVEKIRQAQAMREEIAKTDASVSSWTEHLTAKYGLSEGDAVDEAGKIVRK